MDLPNRGQMAGRLLLIFLLFCVFWRFNEAKNAQLPRGWAKGYVLQSRTDCSNGRGASAGLELIQASSVYGEDVQKLKVAVRHETSDRLHVRITNFGPNQRWEVPQIVLPRPILDDGNACSSASNIAEPALDFQFTEKPFGFAVVRSDSGKVLFNSTPHSLNSFEPLVFKDQYLEISTALPKDAALYGLGESTQSSGFRLVPGKTYTLYNSDVPSSQLGVDLYGAHPFYLDVREDGEAHGVFLLNSNGMDVLFRDGALTYKVIGGVFDFYFFSGPSPLAVIQQYTDLIGRPAPMPYWSLGWQQSRFGYTDIQELEAVVANYSKASIPLDVMWSDIDFMLVWKDFTLDPIHYPYNRTLAFVEQLHRDDQRYVIIIDPGIHIEANYTPYDRGLEQDIFLRDARGKHHIAQVWPGPVHFPDFLHPNIESYWGREISDFYKLLPFDGLWIDMNEASNFCDGIVCDLPDHACPKSLLDPFTCCLVCNNSLATRWDDPPYKINSRGSYAPTYTKTIALSVQHYGGVREYDAHNLYGLSESVVTNKALRSITGKRPFILSRSTFPGSGAHVAHWTGDNDASWYDMAYSISQILNFGLFGIPMVGADICGFTGPTTEELCLRWTQLGAFYPFARDHSDIKSTPQEPYRWESVANSTRNVLALRYRLLPTLYSLVYEAHTLGSPIARPLFFSFAKDPVTLNIDKQFLLGESILVSPVLMPKQEKVWAYFPQGTWYSLFDFSQVIYSEEGQWLAVDAPNNTIPVHVRDGSILPMQEAALTTAAGRKTQFSLLVAFSQSSENQSATGQLFLDDGESLEMKLADGYSTLIRYDAMMLNTNAGMLKATVQFPEFAKKEKWILDRVILLGVAGSALGTLTVNGDSKLNDMKVGAKFHGPTLTIQGLRHALSDNLSLAWSTFQDYADSD